MARKAGGSRLHGDAAVGEGILARLARTVLRHRRLVFAAWAVIFVGGMVAAGPVSNRLTIDTDLKVLATGLGAGILLDATVVRALLVPALVALFGAWNWWMPASLERLLRLRPAGITRGAEPGEVAA